eukprot:CAMPEP_0184327526 /NCGR_PEP_ID=MMETSP1049-20130417/143140_1 /TAXON_ID=77928 /ORGANISM="Proteomonas sulcata, Strain CCMP704" /LENGTH=231 /DNA_ID=CAMNT_0026649785 /DNA_START=520 /DNA_END=1215 /DNA_ORIENTATION=-
MFRCGGIRGFCDKFPLQVLQGHDGYVPASDVAAMISSESRFVIEACGGIRGFCDKFPELLKLQMCFGDTFLTCIQRDPVPDYDNEFPAVDQDCFRDESLSLTPTVQSSLTETTRPSQRATASQEFLVVPVSQGGDPPGPTNADLHFPALPQPEKTSSDPPALPQASQFKAPNSIVEEMTVVENLVRELQLNQGRMLAARVSHFYLKYPTSREVISGLGGLKGSFVVTLKLE